MSSVNSACINVIILLLNIQHLQAFGIGAPRTHVHSNGFIRKTINGDNCFRRHSAVSAAVTLECKAPLPQGKKTTAPKTRGPESKSPAPAPKPRSPKGGESSSKLTPKSPTRAAAAGSPVEQLQWAADPSGILDTFAR